MKAFVIALVVSAAATGCQHAQQTVGTANAKTIDYNVTDRSVAVAGVSLSVRSSTRIPVGEPIPLTVLLRNASPTPFPYRVASERAIFEVTVRDASGDFARPTLEGYRTAPGLGFLVTRLEPGEEVIRTYDLAKLWDLKNPGLYTFDVRRAINETNPEKEPILLEICRCRFNIVKR
jgi:hypothetical protein